MQIVDPCFAGTNKGHYSPGMVSNGMVYISGQLSIDMDTRQVPPPDMRVHAALALNNMDRVLKAAGLGRENVVQCRVYVTDIDAWDAVNDVYAEFFGACMPARCIVNVPKLHFGCLVEIEAVAEYPQGSETGII